MWMIEIKKKRNPNFSETQIDLGIFLSESSRGVRRWKGGKEIIEAFR